MDNAIQGIRRCESTKRAARYKEPIVCRMYNKTEHVNVGLPILDWTNEDVAEFITSENIQCAPVYYDEQGKFHVERRLGCIGCPLATRNIRLNEFKQYPKMVKLWCDAGTEFLSTHSDSKAAQYHKDGYSLFVATVFFDRLYDFKGTSEGLIKNDNYKAMLEDYFKIEL